MLYSCHRHYGCHRVFVAACHTVAPCHAVALCCTIVTATMAATEYLLQHAVQLLHVVYTYNFTQAWHFLCGATQDCDACHAALQHEPRQLLSVGHARGISYCLPCVALPRLLLSLVFLALLYMYDVILCIHFYFTYFLCLAHTGWLWLRAFHWGDWHGGRFQLLMHTPALYYCVITHCTA